MKDQTTTRISQADPEHAAKRRVVYIMLGIIVVEAWGLVAMVHGLRRNQMLELIQYRDQFRVGWIMAATVALLFSTASARSLLLSFEELLRPSWMKLLALPFAFFAGTLEELLFRRVVMDALSQRGFGYFMQVASSAVLFGVVHVFWGFFGGGKAIVSAFGWTMGLGGMLAVTYLVASRDVAPCIWAHILIDFVIEPSLLLTFVRRSTALRSSERQEHLAP